MRMKNIATIFITSVVWLTAIGITYAKPEEAAKKITTIKLGRFVPNSSAIKDTVGKRWYFMGLEGPIAITARTEDIVGLEYISKSRSYGGIDVQAQSTALLLTRKWTGLGEEVIRVSYWGVGLGMYWETFEMAGRSTHKSRIGWHILGGLRLSRSGRLEVKQNWVEGTDRTDWGGLYVSLSWLF